MKQLIKRIFLDHWPRKAISMLLAVVIWLTVNHSLITTKTFDSIPVRLINLAPDKTVDGIQKDGILPGHMELTLKGRRSFLNDLSSTDLEVLIDATGKPDEWITSITKKNLISHNPDIDPAKGIKEVSHKKFIVRLTKLVTDKVPVLITQPLGDSPRGYKFLDIWPYRLNMTVVGPEEVIKRLKSQALKLTFNLNNISKLELDTILSSQKSTSSDEVGFFVPKHWKLIQIPELSDVPMEVDDPQANLLRIDFVRSELLELGATIPVAFYFPQETIEQFNPENRHFAPSPLLKDINGIKYIDKQLFVKGVSQQFVKLVRNMLQISIAFFPDNDKKTIDWSILFINNRTLENAYVSQFLSENSDPIVQELLPSLREEYLRNRFRSYMNHFKLYNKNDTLFTLDITQEEGEVLVTENTP